MREFLFVDDMAEASCLCFRKQLNRDIYNVGLEKILQLKELAETITKVTGHQGDIIWDQ
jgi:GDP-L-fucose synthase